MRQRVVAEAARIAQLHDVASILSRVCATDDVAVWRWDGSTRFDHVAGPLPDYRRVDAPGGRDWRTPQRIEGDEARAFARGGSPDDATAVFTVPMQGDPTAVFVASLAFGPLGPPQWLSLHAATVLTHHLTHRLVVAETDRRAGLARRRATWRTHGCPVSGARRSDRVATSGAPSLAGAMSAGRGRRAAPDRLLPE